MEAKCSNYPKNKGYSQGFHLYLKRKQRSSPPPNVQVHCLADLFKPG
jgi:hypothetical protein